MLTLLLQYRHNIHRSAGAQRHQYRFHWSRSVWMSGAGVEQHRVPGVRSCLKLSFLFPYRASRHCLLLSWLVGIVGHRFGVNKYTVNLRILRAEVRFERGDDLVNTLHRHVIGERAMARDLDSFRGPAYDDFVNIHDVAKA